MQKHKDFHDFTPEALGFKQIPGFSDYYASKSGDIFSIKSGKLVRKKFYNAKDGYCTTGLTPDDDTKQYRYRVHRIIAQTWLENLKNLPTVNHKDGDGRNNKVDNLEWASHSDQVKHAVETGLLKRKTKEICQADEEGNLIAEFSSMKEAYEKTGVSINTISAACVGKYRMSGGFTWYYKENFVGQKMRKFGNCKTVHQYTLKGKFLKEYESVNEAAETMGVHPSTMAEACRGIQKTCKGYVWEYAPKKAKLDLAKKYKNWVILDEYPKYRISKDGRIFSLFHNKMLSPSIRKNKVKTVNVKNKGGVSKTISVHQLVARAYLPNPKGFPLVKHLDDDPSNNNVENLEWDNHSGNGFDAYKTGINSNVHPVIRTDAKTGKELERYGSVVEAAKKMGVTRTSISYALNGRTQTCCGFKLIYG